MPQRQDLDSALATELDAVPEYSAFLGPADLDAGLRRLAGTAGELRLLGRSRGGRPLHCLTVGTGPMDALVFGLPHPNEPIGGLTALHLAQRLVDNQAIGLAASYRWHIIPCIDPDGLALNEGWLSGPFTLEHYARHFFRPAGNEQVEWTFPFSYKRATFDATIPETRALMRLIDETRPALLVSLHNSELGGAYFYLSRPEPSLYPVLSDLPGRFGVDLHRGEPEAPFIEVLAEGIHLWPTAEESYDYLESLNLDPVASPSGATSGSYAAQYGTLTLVSELPYWKDSRAGDARPSESDLPTALQRQARDMEDVIALMNRGLTLVSPTEVEASPLLRAVTYFAPLLTSIPTAARERAKQPHNNRLATIAELQSVEDLVTSYRLRYVGMLRRGLECSGVRPGSPVARELAERHDGWLEEARSHHTVEALPIGDLVAIQYGAILATADRLRK